MKLFQLVFHICSKMLCHLFHALLDITDLVLKPIHVIFIGKHDALPFMRVLIFNLKNICILLQRGFRINCLQAQWWCLTLECCTNTPASIVFKRFLFPSPGFGECCCNWLREGASFWQNEECCFDRFWVTKFGVCHSRNWGAGFSLGDEYCSDCLQATGEWEWEWLGTETGGSGVLLCSRMGGKSECSSDADSTCVWWGESGGWG